MYPKHCEQPMHEDLLFTGHPEPTSIAYATAKLAGLQMGKAYNQQYGYQRFTTLIPNSVYGPCDNFDPNNAHVLSAIMGKLIRARDSDADSLTLWGTGTPRREFVYSGDVAKAIEHCLLSDDTPSVMNIGTGIDYSIKDLATLISKTVGFTGDILWDTSKPDGSMRKLLDNSKLASTGFHCETPLKAGLEKTYEWFQSTMKKGALA
jgi:GDP-L-fucose synthase